MLCWVLTSPESRSTVILFIIIIMFGVFGLRARCLPSAIKASAYKMNYVYVSRSKTVQNGSHPHGFDMLVGIRA